jgi:putative phosphoesterase
MIVAALSDTHIPTQLRALPAALLDRLKGVDRILHAGDLVSGRVLEALGRIAPTVAVAGNCDPPEVAQTLPRQLVVDLNGHVVGVQHGHQPHGLQTHYIGRSYGDPAFALFFQAMIEQLPGAELVIFGHFHSPLVQRDRGCLFVNPGAVAPTDGRSTFALLHVDDGIRAEIIELPP